MLTAALACVAPALLADDNLPDSGSVVLRPEEDREWCRQLAAGETWHYRFDANHPLVFTAHYHQDSEAHAMWRKDELSQGDGNLSATVAARYCLTWFNYQDGALTLRWSLSPLR